MNANSEPTRSRLIKSHELISRYQWILLRAFRDSLFKKFGETGLDVLERGIRSYGHYRARSIRHSPGSFSEPLSAAAIVNNWDGGELSLAEVTGGVQITGNGEQVSVTFGSQPGSDYFKDSNSGILSRYWTAMLNGLAEGYDARAEAKHVLGDDGAWKMIISFEDGGEGREVSPILDVFNSIPDATRLTRRVLGLLGALQMYITREVLNSFDASGAQAVREASYQFGAERGSAIRAQHEAEGKPISLQSFLGGLNERDPYGALFIFEGPSHLSDGVAHFDCTYCPVAEVWAEEGEEGLRLGYLFDESNHRGLFESYHPGAVVRWDAVKSRGDAVCKFRISIPDLVTQNDPPEYQIGITKE